MILGSTTDTPILTGPVRARPGEQRRRRTHRHYAALFVSCSPSHGIPINPQSLSRFLAAHLLRNLCSEERNSFTLSSSQVLQPPRLEFAVSDVVFMGKKRSF